jgi:hypothetical protein
MTPSCSGKWKDMEAVTDPFEADYVALLDGDSNVPFPKDRALYFGQHPVGSSSYRGFSNIANKKRCFPVTNNINPGEWWISYDYDTLTALEPPKKTKDLVSITTYRQDDDKPTYAHRIRFLEEFVKRSKNIDIYGRQISQFQNNFLLKDVYRGVAGISEDKMNVFLGEHIIGKDIEIDYRYALDFDVGINHTGKPTHNYFSERFYDSMLLWTMPIYFGSDNLHDYLPKDSFINIDISGSLGEIDIEIGKILALMSWYREEHLKDIAEARERLLNEYQLWAYVYNKIKGL